MSFHHRSMFLVEPWGFSLWRLEKTFPCGIRCSYSYSSAACTANKANSSANPVHSRTHNNLIHCPPCCSARRSLGPRNACATKGNPWQSSPTLTPHPPPPPPPLLAHLYKTTYADRPMTQTYVWKSFIQIYRPTTLVDVWGVVGDWGVRVWARLSNMPESPTIARPTRDNTNLGFEEALIKHIGPQLLYGLHLR